jgi:hypothetical protein
VFEPFEVRPESAHYQIGGAFALHDQDCVWIRGEGVQQLVAVQWALTHWNQQTRNERVKLGECGADGRGT